MRNFKCVFLYSKFLLMRMFHRVVNGSCSWWTWMLDPVLYLCDILLLVVVWLSGGRNALQRPTHCLSPLNILKCKTFFFTARF